MDRKTLTITAIITVIGMIAESSYLTAKSAPITDWLSFAAIMFLITWGVVALVRFFVLGRRRTT